MEGPGLAEAVLPVVTTVVMDPLEVGGAMQGLLQGCLNLDFSGKAHYMRVLLRSVVTS